MAVWVWGCALFRGSKSAGYAAVVAAFTCPIVFGVADFSDLLAVSSRSRNRTEMTSLAVVLYVAVENLLWPVLSR
jgi:hypothetical protein